MLVAPCTCWAEAAGSDTSPPAVEALEEVVVTARRRAEDLQQTPLSISVLTGSDLEQRSIGTLQRISEQVANLRASVGPQGGSSSHYFIRGVGQLDFIASTDPGVGTYLDGVYLGRTTGAALELLNVERVEVLRGPQGTLFGRNAIGGAINVVTAEPGSRRPEFAVVAGSRNHREARAQFAGALVPGSLTGDLAILDRTQDGWQRRLVDGGRFGDDRTTAGRVSLLWHAGPRLAVRISLDATRTRGTADPHVLVAANPARGGRPGYVLSDPSLTWAGQRSPDDLDASGLAMTATYDLGAASLRSISSYRSLDSDTGADFDGSPFPDLDQRVVTHQSQWSQELQLSGRAWQGRLQWLVGLYGYRERVSQAIPVVLYGSLLSQNNLLENRSGALFSHVSANLAPKWSLSAGARYSHETKQHSFDHYFVTDTGNTALFAPTTLRHAWPSFTPKAGIEYHARADLMTYGSVSQGFRSGGFNGRPFGSDEFLPYGPEKLTTYEAGLKGEWLQHRLRTNGAIYYSRYRDIQLTRTTIGSSGAPIVVTGNAGEAELYGAELDITAAPSDRLLLTANLGHQHNRYVALLPGAAVHAGDQLPVSPRWTASAAIEYMRALPGEAGRLRARVDFSYTSAFNYFFDNPPLSWQGACALWNARLTWLPPSGAWQLAAYVLNAGDRQHSSFIEDVRESFGTAIYWPAAPREFGLEARLRF